MCCLYIYTSQYVKGNFTAYKVYNVFFEDRQPLRYTTNCNTATYNFAYKKIDKLGLEKPTSLSLE